MAQKGDLMTARSDIRVLDATIRDGGLVNNFMFSDDFINQSEPAEKREIRIRDPLDFRA